MGEYVWTVFTIGGKATTETLDRLEEMTSHYEDGSGSVREAVEQKETYSVSGECNFGGDEVLEAFLIENQLTYHKAWGARSGVFDAGVEYWRPGMSAPIEVSADDDGEPVISLTKLKQEANKGLNLPDIIDQLEKAQAAAVPPLEWHDLLAGVVPFEGAPA